MADRIEYLTYSKEERRETNAKRYMSAFSQRPYQTWAVIEGKLEPYMKKLGAGAQKNCNEFLNEIQNMFTVETFKNNEKLDGLYLLGFHHQSSYMASKKEEEK